jgi:hypothetical protein
LAGAWDGCTGMADAAWGKSACGDGFQFGASDVIRVVRETIRLGRAAQVIALIDGSRSAVRISHAFFLGSSPGAADLRTTAPQVTNRARTAIAEVWVPSATLKNAAVGLGKRGGAMHLGAAGRGFALPEQAIVPGFAIRRGTTRAGCWRSDAALLFEFIRDSGRAVGPGAPDPKLVPLNAIRKCPVAKAQGVPYLTPPVEIDLRRTGAGAVAHTTRIGRASARRQLREEQ